jgi:hypothetical protein
MFTLTLDTKAMIAELDEIRRNQVPFAMSLAMNVTMEQVQLAQRHRIESQMTLRRRTFVLRLVKIAAEDRAVKDRLTSSVRIEGPKAQPQRGQVLTRHETGGARHGKNGAPLFLPTQRLRPTPASAISQALYPAKLMVNGSPAGRGIFTLTPDMGSKLTGRGAGIFRRVGHGKGGLIKLWRYLPTTTLDPSLAFDVTFHAIVTAEFNKNFTGALGYALDERQQAAGVRTWKAATLASWQPPRAAESE